MVVARLDDLRDTTEKLLEKTSATLGGAPPRPNPKALAHHVFGPYEDLVFEKRRLVTPPRELAEAAAHAARALSAHVSAVANLEEIARVARGTAPSQQAAKEPVVDPRTGRREAGPEDGGGPVGGPDEIAKRRFELVRDFVSELQDGCVRLRPAAGALRLEARMRLVKRFQEAAEAALSIFDQIITEVPTLMGRSRALPSCVACNRPLPTRQRREKPAMIENPPLAREPRPPLTEVQQLLASKGPEMPRPLSAPGTRRRDEDIIQSRSAKDLRRAAAPPPEAVPGSHSVGSDATAFLRQRAEYDAAEAKRELRRQQEYLAAKHADALDLSAPPAPRTGFRATKRVNMNRPQSAPRGGRR